MISYASISIPEPFTILGLRLKPFCLGHYILLSKYGCSFVNEGEEVEVGMPDLILGLSICSMTYEQGLKYTKGLEFIQEKNKGFIFSREGRKEAKAAIHFTKQWGKQVTKAIKKQDGFNQYAELKAFARYIKEGSKQPNYFFDDEDDGRPRGGHWTQNMLLTLKSELGYSNSEAMNLPLSQVFYDYIKHCENNGTITMETEQERKLLEKQL